jgi:heme/copper-type cytochrome/quinol oxidase subunit 2
LKNSEADKRRMTIELEVVPTPPQKDFEQYVQEQATAAQRDAKDAGFKSNEQLAKNKQPKPLNPMTLFRW